MSSRAPLLTSALSDSPCPSGASVALASGAHGQIEVGSDGSDGTFEPASSITVVPAQADIGPGSGHYDPVSWAAVFNYTSVNIPSGVIVSFSNYPSGAPVMWLVGGNALIDGGVNLDGENDTGASARPSIAGPGGFRGSRAFLGAQSQDSGGCGPGGGDYAAANTPGIRWKLRNAG